MLIRKREYRKDYWKNMFQTIFANLEEILIAADAASGNIEYISPNAEHILGVRQEREGAAANLLKQLGLIEAPDLTLLRGREIQRTESYLTNIQTGEPLWCRSYWGFLQLYGDSNEKVVINISDRSKEKGTMEQIQRDLKEAKRSNAAKSRFLTTISHDMRTPMNTIMGLTELAIEHIDERERVRDYLHRISSASTHLLDLVNDVLDMERIESGRLNMEYKTFSMMKLLKDVADLIQSQAADKMQIMETEWNVEHDSLIGDPVRIRQIIINILSNAVKYTQRGGSLFFQVKELYDSGAHTCFKIKIHDNGYGMSETFQQIIFEPFAKERSQASEEIEGTGLGMSITKRLVDLMGGTLSVESRLGEGTLFTVEVPLEIGQEEIGYQEEMNTRREYDCGGCSVLLVEDNEITADVLRDILELMNAKVRWAENGQRAVEIFEKEGQNYDLILMDVQMPVMDGYDATRQIRKGSPQGAGIPIVALTGNAFREDVQASREAGMDWHLSKPVKKKELEHLIQKILDN